MPSKTETMIARLEALLTAQTPDQEALRDCAAALLDQFRRQSRQIDRLVKLSDANEEKLTSTNATLSSLTRNLARFVPETVVDSLMKSGGEQLAGTERRQLTVFFSDIVGFTSMTEQLEPEQLSTLLMDYFSEMNRLCARWGGTLDQFIGDAIVIFFGAPKSKGAQTDACNAAGMALEMQARLQALRVKWADEGLSPPLHVRMGLATGYATVGNFGSDSRLHYTAIGNAVNSAARIQALAPSDGILIDADTQALVQDSLSCQRGETVTLRGRKHPVQLYEVTAGQSERANDFVVGSGDGFRLFLDSAVLSDKQKALSLLREAVRQIEEQDDPPA